MSLIVADEPIDAPVPAPVPVSPPVVETDPLTALQETVATLSRRVAALELFLGRGTGETLEDLSEAEASRMLATNPANLAPFLESSKLARQALRNEQEQGALTP